MVWIVRCSGAAKTEFCHQCHARFHKVGVELEVLEGEQVRAALRARLADHVASDFRHILDMVAALSIAFQELAHFSLSRLDWMD
ncbi:adenylyl-sulfate kinase [Devosia soli]|uniref:adenylyl-sulfate kinase n=1 Tax=Devosia soli TaxID=361041 RepID=UPI003CC7A6A7